MCHNFKLNQTKPPSYIHKHAFFTAGTVTPKAESEWDSFHRGSHNHWKIYQTNGELIAAIALPPPTWLTLFASTKIFLNKSAAGQILC